MEIRNILRLPRRHAAKYALFVYLGVSVVGWLGVIGFLYGQVPSQWTLSPRQLLAILLLGGITGFAVQYMAVMSVINARNVRSQTLSTSGKIVYRCVVIFVGIVAVALTLYATVAGLVLAVWIFPIYLSLWF